MQSLDLLTQVIKRTPPVRRIGRICRLSSSKVEVSGLSDISSVGHQVEFASVPGLTGEVGRVGGETVEVMVDGDPNRLKIGDPVRHVGEVELYPHDSWLGRVVDGNGEPLDDKPLMQGKVGVGRLASPPEAVKRRSFGARLSTGYSLFNTILPFVTGQRLGLFAGSGVGKSSLMAAFARDVEADVVVIALIGERGREVRQFIDKVLGKKGLRRSVVVAATSDQSALARRRAAFTAMAVAEHFRNQGRHVLLMLDSITRLAEAHRVIASASGEPNSMRGYPPSLAALLAGFAERAGPGAEGQGDITAILTVLVSGSDMEEPVADILRGLLDGHVVMSRDIAERGRFPAVDVLQSVSRSLPEAATDEENALIAEARRTLSIFEESELMVRSGLYQPESNPELDRAVTLHPGLDIFAADRAESVAEAFEQLKARLSPGARATAADSPPFVKTSS